MTPMQTVVEQLQSRSETDVLSSLTILKDRNTLEEYMKLCPTLEEMLGLLQFHKSNPSIVNAAFSVIRTAVKLNRDKGGQELIHFIRSLWHDHRQLLDSLLSSSDIKLKLTAIRLLSTLIQSDVSVALSIMKTFNFDSPAFKKLYMDKNGKPAPTRYPFVQLCIAMLQHDHVQIIYAMSKHESLIPRLLQYCALDREDEMTKYLDAVLKSIVQKHGIDGNTKLACLHEKSWLSMFQVNNKTQSALILSFARQTLVSCGLCVGHHPVSWDPSSHQRILALKIACAMRPYESKPQKDMLFEFCSNVAAFRCAYMQQFPYTLEPRESFRWNMHTSLLSQLLMLPSYSKSDQWNPVPSWTLAVSNQCLLHKGHMVRFFFLQMLLSLCKHCHCISKQEADLWIERIPNSKTLLQVLTSHLKTLESKQSRLIVCLVLAVFQHYAQLFPSLFEEGSFDLWKLLLIPDARIQKHVLATNYKLLQHLSWYRPVHDIGTVKLKHGTGSTVSAPFLSLLLKAAAENKEQVAIDLLTHSIIQVQKQSEGLAADIAIIVSSLCLFKYEDDVVLLFHAVVESYFQKCSTLTCDAPWHPFLHMLLDAARSSEHTMFQQYCVSVLLRYACLHQHNTDVLHSMCLWAQSAGSVYDPVSGICDYLSQSSRDTVHTSKYHKVDEERKQSGGLSSTAIDMYESFCVPYAKTADLDLPFHFIRNQVVSVPESSPFLAKALSRFLLLHACKKQDMESSVFLAQFVRANEYRFSAYESKGLSGLSFGSSALILDVIDDLESDTCILSASLLNRTPWTHKIQSLCSAPSFTRVALYGVPRVAHFDVDLENTLLSRLEDEDALFLLGRSPPLSSRISVQKLVSHIMRSRRNFYTKESISFIVRQRADICNELERQVLQWKEHGVSLDLVAVIIPILLKTWSANNSIGSHDDMCRWAVSKKTLSRIIKLDSDLYLAYLSQCFNSLGPVSKLFSYLEKHAESSAAISLFLAEHNHASLSLEEVLERITSFTPDDADATRWVQVAIRSIPSSTPVFAELHANLFLSAIDALLKALQSHTSLPDQDDIVQVVALLLDAVKETKLPISKYVPQITLMWETSRSVTRKCVLGLLKPLFYNARLLQWNVGNLTRLCSLLWGSYTAMSNREEGLVFQLLASNDDVHRINFMSTPWGGCKSSDLFDLFDPKLLMQGYKTMDSEVAYDPAFLLPLFCFHLESGRLDTQLRRIVSHGFLSYALLCIALESTDHRLFAYRIVEYVYEKLGEKQTSIVFPEHQQVWTCLAILKNSIDADFARLPRLVLSFFASATVTFLFPESPVYEAVLQFLLFRKFPSISLQTPPGFEQLFFGQEKRVISQETGLQQRIWILDVYERGIDTTLDTILLQRRHVPDIAMHFLTQTVFTQERRQIASFLTKLLMQRKAFNDMVQQGLFSWLATTVQHPSMDCRSIAMRLIRVAVMQLHVAKHISEDARIAMQSLFFACARSHDVDSIRSILCSLASFAYAPLEGTTLHRTLPVHVDLNQYDVVLWSRTHPNHIPDDVCASISAGMVCLVLAQEQSNEFEAIEAVLEWLAIFFSSLDRRSRFSTLYPSLVQELIGMYQLCDPKSTTDVYRSRLQFCNAALAPFVASKLGGDHSSPLGLSRAIQSHW